MRPLLLAVALALLSACGSAAPPAATPVATSPYKFPRPAELPPVSDATGLSGARLVATAPARLPGAAADGTARFSVLSSGGDRPYLLAPARRTAPRADPALLVVLPAANRTLREEYDRYGLDALRDHGLTVLVAGTYAASWNAGGGCCGRPASDGVDDVAALLAMRTDAARRTRVDAARTGVVGHSVGGLMAWRLACTPSFRAQAVVAVSGTLTAGCPALPAVPAFLAVHGAQDATVPVDGSRTRSRLLGVAPPSVRDSLAELAAAAGCTGRTGSGGTTTHSGCRGGGSVRLTVVPGAGHPWEALDATRRTAAFLADALSGVR